MLKKLKNVKSFTVFFFNFLVQSFLSISFTREKLWNENIYKYLRILKDILKIQRHIGKTEKRQSGR